jgi:hypothetical protein
MPADTPCPTDEVLGHFVLGDLTDLPADALDELAGHVERCARCVAAMAALRGEDSLLRALRAPSQTPPEPLNRTVEQLIAKLCHDRATLATPPLVARDADDWEDASALLAPPEAPDEIGRLGPYRVLQVLGAGGMGVVFRAFDPQLRREVAVKTLKPGLAASAAARRRFLR